MAVCAVLLANRPIKPKIRGFLAFRAYVPLFAPTTMLNVFMVLAIPEACTHGPTVSATTISLYRRAHGFRDHNKIPKFTSAMSRSC